MTLIEETKSMLDVLPESDIQVIYAVTKNLFEKESSPFKPLSKHQILADLEESRRQITNGECLDFDQAVNEIVEEYGL